MTSSIEPGGIAVIGNDGLRGTLAPAGSSSSSAAREVVLADGRRILVPPQLLQLRPDGSLYLALTPAEVDAADASTTAASSSLRRDIHPPADAGAVEIVPLLEEQLVLNKRQVEAGRVRVHKTVQIHEQVIETPLLREEVDVERVRVDRLVSEAPPIRHEGDVMIIPVLEEVLVVQKQLVVREELRVTTRRTQTHEQQTVTLRKETAHIQRVPAENQDQ